MYSGKNRTFALFHNIGIYWLKKELPHYWGNFFMPDLPLPTLEKICIGVSSFNNLSFVINFRIFAFQTK